MVWNMLYKLHSDQIVYCMLCVCVCMFDLASSTYILFERGRRKKIKAAHITLRNIIQKCCMKKKNWEKSFNVSSDKWKIFSLAIYFSVQRSIEWQTHNIYLRHWMSERFDSRKFISLFQKPITRFISIKSNSLSVVLFLRSFFFFFTFDVVCVCVFLLVWTHFYCSICRTLCRVEYKNERKNVCPIFLFLVCFFWHASVLAAKLNSRQYDSNSEIGSAVVQVKSQK